MASGESWTAEADGDAAFALRGYSLHRGLLPLSLVERAIAALESLRQRATSGAADFVFEPGGGDGSVERAPRYRSRRGEFFAQLEPGAAAGSGEIRKLMHFCELDPILEQLGAPDGVVGSVAARLLGGEVRRFQDMALLKPAGGGEKPWHQDCAYFSILPLDAVVGVWIALDEARVDNGCMHLLPGEQRGGPRRHRIARDCELAEAVEFSRATAVEMPPGSALFFSGLLPHATPPNRSERPRRALQFHFCRSDAREVEAPEYDASFVDATGSPASCAAAARRGGS